LLTFHYIRPQDLSDANPWTIIVEAAYHTVNVHESHCTVHTFSNSSAIYETFYGYQDDVFHLIRGFP